MKKYLNKYILTLCVCVTLLGTKQSNAQTSTIKYNSHVTDALGLPNTNAIAGTAGVGATLSDTFKERLDDVFAVVVAAGADAEANNSELLAFQVGDKTVFNIRVQDGKIDVRRRIGDISASYIIYDSLFHFRNLFTIIVSPNYIAIMVDEEGAKWNIAPVLFGLNSNEGTDKYSAGVGSHVTPFFDAGGGVGRLRSTYDHTIYPMTDAYDTYAEIQAWLDDPAQQARAANAKTSVSKALPVSELEEEVSVDFYAYPNPSSEYITIQGAEAQETLFIYDVLGNKILETVEKEINVSTYSPGLYFVKKGSSKNVLKFVKQ